MEKTILERKGALFSGGVVLLAAALAALLLAFAAARPSEAQATNVVTIDPSSIDFGSVNVSANPETRQITVTNNGLLDIVIGGVDILGTRSDAFDLQTNLG